MSGDSGENVSGRDDEPGERARRLDEMERRLEAKERELEQREADLDEREAALRERREKTVQSREDLEDRAAELDRREEKIDEREAALDSREQELRERAAELDRKEETLSEYVGDRFDELEAELAETVTGSVSEAIEGHDLGGGSRFGTIGGLLLGLVGMVLVVGGVANGFATEIAGVPTLFSSSAGNFGASAVLMFSGLAANLAAAAGRV